MTASYKPHSYNSASPYLVVDGADRTINFLKTVFDAVELRRFPDSAGKVMHAEMRIDDTVIMIADGNEGWPPVPAFVHLYVSDVDATYRRALHSGASSVQEPVKKDDEDKRGGVKDAGGTTWWIATRVEGNNATNGNRGASKAGDDANDKPPVLGPEHQRLGIFAGKWKGKGKILAGAPSEAGSDVTIEDSYEWMPGGFFLLHRGSMQSSAQTLTSIQIIGADAASNSFPSHQFDSLGFCRAYEGRLQGDTWKFTGRWERASLTFSENNDKLTARWERSEDGSAWLPLCEYTASRIG